MKYNNVLGLFLKIKEETSKVKTQLSINNNLKFEINHIDGKNDFTINIVKINIKY